MSEERDVWIEHMGRLMDAVVDAALAWEAAQTEVLESGFFPGEYERMSPDELALYNAVRAYRAP
jgi:hypothetical protein